MLTYSLILPTGHTIVLAFLHFENVCIASEGFPECVAEQEELSVGRSKDFFSEHAT